MKRLGYGKGVLDLLEIWKEVCKVKNNAKLAIIGGSDKEVRNKIKEYISKNFLQNNIFFLGAIYDFDVKFRILNSSKLFILPSHEENWAIVIGEAMAIKLPVVAYDLKEIRPIWGDNVEWIEFGNIKAFSNKILDYLLNNEKREFLTQKAYKFIEEYDWKEIAEKEFEGVI